MSSVPRSPLPDCLHALFPTLYQVWPINFSAVRRKPEGAIPIPVAVREVMYQHRWDKVGVCN
jgi:hypothetical protein